MGSFFFLLLQEDENDAMPTGVSNEVNEQQRRGRGRYFLSTALGSQKRLRRERHVMRAVSWPFGSCMWRRKPRGKHRRASHLFPHGTLTLVCELWCDSSERTDRFFTKCSTPLEGCGGVRYGECDVVVIARDPCGLHGS